MASLDRMGTPDSFSSCRPALLSIKTLSAKLLSSVLLWFDAKIRIIWLLCGG